MNVIYFQGKVFIKIIEVFVRKQFSKKHFFDILFISGIYCQLGYSSGIAYHKISKKKKVKNNNKKKKHQKRQNWSRRKKSASAKKAQENLLTYH